MREMPLLNVEISCRNEGGQIHLIFVALQLTPWISIGATVFSMEHASARLLQLQVLRHLLDTTNFKTLNKMKTFKALGPPHIFDGEQWYAYLYSTLTSTSSFLCQFIFMEIARLTNFR